MVALEPLDLFRRFCFLTSDITTENQSKRRLPIMVKSGVLHTTGLDRMSVNESRIEISIGMGTTFTILLKPSCNLPRHGQKPLQRAFTNVLCTQL